MVRTRQHPGMYTGTGEAMKAMGQARLELSGASTPDHLWPPARGVGGYNHGDTGKEGEWTPLLLYANPLGHHVPATSFIARFMRNDIDISGDHYEMIGKVAFGVSEPGGGWPAATSSACGRKI